MNIAIFAIDTESARKYLENLIGEMKWKEVEYFMIRPICEAKLRNGDKYRVFRCDDSMRGHKFTKAFVSTSVSKEFVDWRIIPSMYTTDGNEEEIVYFDESRSEEE